MAKKQDPSSRDESNLSFEEALGAVESIIDSIESGEIGLEKSMTEYERAVKLIVRCREVLDGAEERIEMLTKDLKPAGRSEGE